MIDILVALPLISVGVMVWDAFDYATDVAALRSLYDKDQELEARSREISAALATIAAELAARGRIGRPD